MSHMEDLFPARQGYLTHCQWEWALLWRVALYSAKAIPDTRIAGPISEIEAGINREASQMQFPQIFQRTRAKALQ